MRSNNNLKEILNDHEKLKSLTAKNSASKSGMSPFMGPKKTIVADQDMDLPEGLNE